jgi:hypothetical protein
VTRRELGTLTPLWTIRPINPRADDRPPRRRLTIPSNTSRANPGRRSRPTSSFSFQRGPAVSAPTRSFRVHAQRFSGNEIGDVRAGQNLEELNSVMSS